MPYSPENSGLNKPQEGLGKDNFDRNFGAQQKALAKQREEAALAARKERIARQKKTREEAGTFIKDPKAAKKEERMKILRKINSSGGKEGLSE